ncbi:MAG: PhnD/SsuA/transferrin family substrate-binding protein [Pseudomonadota bacterium]
MIPQRWARQTLWLAACLAWLLPLHSVWAAEVTSKRPALIVGIAPHTSARALFESYQPLRLFLQDELQCEVRIVSAPDFEEFLYRALNGRYDMAITTGHQARLMQMDAGWIPLVTYQADFRIVLLKAKNGSRIANLSDLHGRRFITLGPGSLTALWSQQHLQERSITPSRLGFVSASDSLAELIVSGAADVGALSQAGVNQLPATLRDRLEIIERSPAFLGRTYILHPRLAGQYADLRSALDAFARSSSGQTYFQRSLLAGFRDVSPAELEVMEPYAKALRTLMAARLKSDVQAHGGTPSTEGIPHVAE